MAEQDEVASRSRAPAIRATQLRRYGIRTATDLEDAFQPARDIADQAERIARLERLLTTSPDEPSVLRTLLATLGSEPNLPYSARGGSPRTARATPAGSR